MIFLLRIYSKLLEYLIKNTYSIKAKVENVYKTLLTNKIYLSKWIFLNKALKLISTSKNLDKLSFSNKNISFLTIFQVKCFKF